MALCDGLISAGIARDCNAVNAAVGVDKDLILVNYDDFDRSLSLATREADATNNNEGGLSNIELKTCASAPSSNNNPPPPKIPAWQFETFESTSATIEPYTAIPPPPPSAVQRSITVSSKLTRFDLRT